MEKRRSREYQVLEERMSREQAMRKVAGQMEVERALMGKGRRQKVRRDPHCWPLFIAFFFAILLASALLPSTASRCCRLRLASALLPSTANLSALLPSTVSLLCSRTIIMNPQFGVCELDRMGRYASFVDIHATVMGCRCQLPSNLAGVRCD